ncbi:MULTISPECIES: VOC family protein [Bacillus cereus group]|uniref:VOC family protein n=1 Tax=Bacillus cereus group TaxID=86661 RepID=UPI0011453353|nr:MULTISPECIES: VOC family protein [Bacillus cereus group]MDR4984836.1 VOC family protein [Bacillus cereus]MEA1011247.1 VOC family protein [Bacillus cereus]
MHHIEFWVKDLEESISFYDILFSIIGWRKLNEVAYSTGENEIYFKEIEEEIVNTLGPRHICYQAIHRGVVDEVAEFLFSTKVKVIRGPIEMNHYSDGYYTIDFYDPNGFIVEVAYTPNTEM